MVGLFTLLIRSIPPQNKDYKDIQEVVDYFKNQKSYDTPYRIFRINTPQGESYTNALILNQKVLVPQIGSTHDEDAVNTYKKAMPGYTVLGFTNIATVKIGRRNIEKVV